MTTTDEVKQTTDTWRILAIDDDETILDAYEELLSEPEGLRELDQMMKNLSSETFPSVSPSPFKMCRATSGQMGFQMVQDALADGKPYAVIYLDMRMPTGWDGLTTAKKIRSVDPNVRIIIITAYMDHSMGELRHEIGIDFEFLMKPISENELSQLTQLYTQQWKQQQQLAQHQNLLEEMVSERTERLEKANQRINRLLEAKAYEHRELELILNSMREGVIAVDHDGNITHANRSIERLTGLFEQNLVGTPAIDLFSKQIHEEMMGGQTLSILHHRLQQIVGSSCEQIELWIQDALLPALVIDEEGIIQICNQVMQEATGWGPEQLIGQSLNQLLPKEIHPHHDKLIKQFFKEAAPRKMGNQNLFPVVNADGTTSQIEIGLLPLQLERGKRVLVLLNDPQQQQWWKLFNITPFGQLFFEEGDLDIGVMIRNQHGDEVPVYVSSSPLFLKGADQEGMHNGAILVIHDLRTAMRAEKERSANEAKDRFLASTSHELRTPLTTIIGNCEILATERMPGGQQEMVRSIDVAGRGLLALINDILDLSKIEAGKFQINRIPFRLSELLHEMEHIFSTRASSAGIHFEIVQTYVPEKQLIGDSRRIAQILINLLGNAIKFTDPEGSIRLIIEHEVQQKQILFSVEDSGIGISPQAIQELFRPFEQADSSIARRYGGTGLGLHISRTLAELMGGTIQVESTKGKGSLFTLHIPLQITELIDQPEPQTQLPLDASFQGHVLVAEDTPELQMLERHLLEKMGVTVSVAGNGEEVLKLTKEHSFDLILMDMQMPIVSGTEATERLRTRGDNTPIVALTANVQQKHRDQFREAGCNDFLCKPIDRQELHQILERYLQQGSDSSRKPQGTMPQKPPKQGRITPSEPTVDQELVTMFREQIEESYQELCMLVPSESWSEIKEIAHIFKGNGETFGYLVLSRWSSAYCQAIGCNDMKNLPLLADGLLKAMEEALREG